MSWVENNEWLRADKDHRIKWSTLVRFLGLYRPHRGRLAAAGLLVLLASSTAFLIPPVFRAIERALRTADVRSAAQALAVFLAITLLEIFVSFWIRLFNAKVSIQLNRDLLLTYYGKILNLGVEDFIAFRQRTNLFQRIIDAMSITGQFTNVLVRGGQLLLVLAVTAVVIGRLSPPVLGIVGTGAALLFLHVVMQAQKISALQKRLLAINYPLVGKMTEILEGLFTIKALAASVRVTSDVGELVHRKARAELEELVAESRSDQIAQAIRQVALVVAVGASFVMMLRNGLVLADVLALYFLAGLALQLVAELALYYQMLAKLSVNVANIYEVLDLDDEDAPSRRAAVAPPAVRAPLRPHRISTAAGLPLPAQAASGHIQFRGVDFAYRNGRGVIKGLDLEILPGEKVSLIGRSGAGKTTLLRLLLGFLGPQQGEILVDGAPVSAVTDKSLYRRQFGVVSQQDFLFDTSLRENLTFGLDDAVPEERIVDALRRVDLWEDVSRLRLGLGTTFSPDIFSGGQKQRFFIARALLRSPSIVLLDEPTSALDFETEQRVIEAIDHLVGRNTTLTIAHRLSTVRNADRVVVLRGGRVEATGSHDHLYAHNDYYRSLCDYNSFMVA